VYNSIIYKYSTTDC